MDDFGSMDHCLPYHATVPLRCKVTRIHVRLYHSVVFTMQIARSHQADGELLPRMLAFISLSQSKDINVELSFWSPWSQKQEIEQKLLWNSGSTELIKKIQNLKKTMEQAWIPKMVPLEKIENNSTKGTCSTKVCPPIGVTAAFKIVISQ